MYCAVICDTQPARARSLITYQLRIIQAAKRYRWLAVCQYDEDFLWKLTHTPSVQWDVVDQDIYTRCFTGQALVLFPLCKRLSYTTNTCTSGDQREPGTTQPACELYNKGRCNFRNCRYRTPASEAPASLYPALSTHTPHLLLFLMHSCLFRTHIHTLPYPRTPLTLQLFCRHYELNWSHTPILHMLPIC